MENSTIHLSLEYLKAVEVEFQHDRIKLDVFKKMLKDFNDEKLDVGGVKVRVKGLFKDHTKLISGFNIFLPKEHQITPNLEYEDASAFIKAIKDAFQDKKETHEKYLDIIFEWKYKRVGRSVDIKSIMARMKELLKEHIDLYFIFEAFVSQTEYSATTGK
jgi:paired amphipathic helix protein Sin3a